MKVAIVGSRSFPREDIVRAAVRAVGVKYPNSVIVSGGARGVDSWAENEAGKVGLTVEIYRPNWNLGRGAGFARNTDIIKASDVVLAFWDLKSRGTMDSVRKAKVLGKKVTVVGPNGEPVDPI